MKANNRQIEVKEQCLISAKEHLVSPHLYDVKISNESLTEGGRLLFTLSITAKPNTGMLFLNDKSWTVVIGRKGSVKSALVGRGKSLTTNKYKLFIA